MTPQFSKRAGIVLQSPYWDKEVTTEEQFNQRMKLLDNEYFPLKDAVQAADSYDDLSNEMKAIWDRAEIAAATAAKEYQHFIQNDTGGYGRFLGDSILPPQPETIPLSTDATGHQHKGKGEGGGQFTATGGGDSTSGKPGSATKEPPPPGTPKHTLPKGSGEEGAREKAQKDMKWRDDATFIVGSNHPNPSLPNETRPQLSDTERGALQNYSYQGDGPLHAKLRGMDYSWSQKTEEFIDELQSGLDSAFAKTPVMKTPARVVRGMNPPPEVAQQFIKNFQQGLANDQPVKIDDSYASTTRPGFLDELMDRMGMKDAVKKPFRGNIKITIDAVHGIDMMPHSILAGERELLLPRGAQFDVVSIKEKGGTHHVHLKQRPPTNPVSGTSAQLAIDNKPVMTDFEWSALVKYYRANPDRLKRWLNQGAKVTVLPLTPSAKG